MNFITAIIIDDEPQNTIYLQGLLNLHCPHVKVLYTCNNPEEAISQIDKLQPQLIFLDIDMPGMNGFELLQRLEPVNFEVIFVTAYNHYALQAFDVHAAGYITKPIAVEKLKAVVEKAVQKIEVNNYRSHIFSLLQQLQPSASREERIALPTQTGMQFIELKDICHCESSGNYTRFHLRLGGTLLVSRQLGEYEKLLPSSLFVRIHEQYIVRLDCIKEYRKGNGGDVILENGTSLPVAARRKEDFLRLFDKWVKRK